MGDGSDDDELRDVVPVALGIEVPRRVRQDLPRFTFEDLKGARVRVRANGFDYRGVLVGADEHELYLRGDLRWVVLPLADVTDVRPDEPERAPRPRDRGDR